MLVLTRKQDQSIVIGDNIKITVGKIRKNQVRLLITAPEELPIVRIDGDAAASATPGRPVHTASSEPSSPFDRKPQDQMSLVGTA